MQEQSSNCEDMYIIHFLNSLNLAGVGALTFLTMFIMQRRIKWVIIITICWVMKLLSLHVPESSSTHSPPTKGMTGGVGALGIYKTDLFTSFYYVIH